MGRIVKAAMAVEPPAGPGEAAAEPAGSEAVAAEVTELLAAARVAANADRLAALDAAVVLARKMAEKIVGRAVELDAGVMREIAAGALAAAKPGKHAVLLRMHPEDLALIEGTRGQWLAEAGNRADVRLLADASVGRHGCVVETAVSRLDARLQTQLDALERALRGAMRARA